MMGIYSSNLDIQNALDSFLASQRLADTLAKSNYSNSSSYAGYSSPILTMPSTSTTTDFSVYGKSQEEQKKAAEKAKSKRIDDYIQTFQDANKAGKKTETDIVAAKAALDTKQESKLGFWDGLKSFGKGALKSVTGMFTNAEGKFSLSKTLLTAGIAVGVIALCSTPLGVVVGPLLLGAGAIAGGLEIFKGASDFDNAKTTEDKKKSLEELGSGTATIALTALGIKGFKAAKAAKLGEAAGVGAKAGEAAGVGAEAGEAEAASGKSGIFSRIGSWFKKTFQGVKEEFKAGGEAKGKTKGAPKAEKPQEPNMAAKKGINDPLASDKEKLATLEQKLGKLKPKSPQYKKAKTEATKLRNHIKEREQTLELPKEQEVPIETTPIETTPVETTSVAPKTTPFGTLVKYTALTAAAPTAVSYLNQAAAEDARKAKEAKDTEDQKAKVTSLEAKQEEIQKHQFDTLKGLAQELEVTVSEYDTIETLKEKIDETLATAA